MGHNYEFKRMFASRLIRNVGRLALLAALCCGLLLSASAQAHKTQPRAIRKVNTDPTEIAKILDHGNLKGTVGPGETTDSHRPDVRGLYYDLLISVGGKSTKITKTAMWHRNTARYFTPYHIDDLPAGKYRVVLGFSGTYHGMSRCFPAQVRDVTIEKGQTTTLDIRFDWMCPYKTGAVHTSHSH